MTLPNSVSTPTCPVSARVIELNNKITKTKAMIPNPIRRNSMPPCPLAWITLGLFGSKMVIAVLPERL